jgi:hypothetical protein
MPSTNLNILQRGILQKCATFFVYFVSIGIGALIIDWLDKRLFIHIAEEAQHKNLISSEAVRGFTILIEARNSPVIYYVIFVGLACGFVGWLFMRWAAKLNWSWPITLHKAIEFRSALQTLDIIDPSERMEFVRKQKLSIFISSSTFLKEYMENVRVKLYPFADHPYFADKDVFEKYTGSQRLCLDIVDYEQLIHEYNQKLSVRNSSILAEKDKEINFLKEELFNKTQDILRMAKEKDKEIDKLMQENENITTRCAELEGKLQTKPGREKKIDNMQVNRTIFWRVGGPLVNDLLRDAQEGKPYTRDEIQTAFERKLNMEFPGLKEEILELLQAGRQNKEPSFDLRGWEMESIRSGLGKYAKKDSGPNRKS